MTTKKSVQSLKSRSILNINNHLNGLKHEFLPMETIEKLVDKIKKYNLSVSLNKLEKAQISEVVRVYPGLLQAFEVDV